MHKESCFITLTYSEDNLPSPPSLSKREHQLFMKKLRRSLAPRKVSFFLCGEYGERFGRPHYHAIIFGWWPPDAKPWKMGPDGSQLYTSGKLEKIWGYGFCAVGAVTFATAAYVAGYVVKKQMKLQDPAAFTYLDPETGEWICLEPEYGTMSRNPAIGKRWLGVHGESDAYRHDKIVSGGKEGPLPRYYDKELKKLDAQRAELVKKKRRIARGDSNPDETRARLLDRAKFEKARANLRKRNVQ